MLIMCVQGVNNNKSKKFKTMSQTYQPKRESEQKHTAF